MKMPSVTAFSLYSGNPLLEIFFRNVFKINRFALSWREKNKNYKQIFFISSMRANVSCSPITMLSLVSLKVKVSIFSTV